MLEENEDIRINLPRPKKIIKLLLILIVLSPWIFVIIFRLDIKGFVQNIMESILLNEQNKKANGFF